MFSEDQGFFGLWLMLSEDQRFWILAHVFRGLGFWNFGLCFQRTNGSRSWLMFSEAWDFDPGSCFQRPRILGLGSCFQRTKGFLGFGSCFQRPRTLDLGLCFQKTKGFGALAQVYKGPKILDPGSCFQRPRIFGSWLMFSEDQGSGSWLMFSET